MLNLPPKLQLLIVENLRRQSDFDSLCATCRQLRSITLRIRRSTCQPRFGDQPDTPPTVPEDASSGLAASPTPPSHFLALPPELRTAIYELIAAGTHLILVPSSPKRTTHIAIPGFLLASRQTRQEYLPILLAHSRVSTSVHYFSLSRLWGSLYNLLPWEQIALTSNSHGLTIQITINRHHTTCGCRNGPENAALREWLERMAGDAVLGAVKSTYEVTWPEPWQDFIYTAIKHVLEQIRTLEAGMNGEKARKALVKVIEGFEAGLHTADVLSQQGAMERAESRSVRGIGRGRDSNAVAGGRVPWLFVNERLQGRWPWCAVSSG